jgi:hypothetical protein
MHTATPENVIVNGEWSRIGGTIIDLKKIIGADLAG